MSSGHWAAKDTHQLLREGDGEPLLLLHGITGSARMWRHVIPLLRSHHHVIAPTALGHHGGALATLWPARIAHVVDDVERLLDRLRYERAHCAGNSMGGWVALELARRGRALSVCALSPAGMWDRIPARTVRKLSLIAAATRGTRRLLPLLAHSARFRRSVLRDNAVHGERVLREDLIGLADDVIGCTVIRDLLSTPEQCTPLSAACPITLAWSQYDRIFPPAKHAPIARQRVPAARFVVLEGVGHVPMFDDPQLVADTILASTAAATRSRPAQAADS